MKTFCVLKENYLNFNQKKKLEKKLKLETVAVSKIKKLSTNLKSYANSTHLSNLEIN